MYDIIELNGKSREELIEIAKKLKVKKPESISDKDLVYVILDEQAIQADPHHQGQGGKAGRCARRRGCTRQEARP